jgi:hypothetical protein
MKSAFTDTFLPLNVWNSGNIDAILEGCLRGVLVDLHID